MVVLLPMLMAYSLIGETFHEVIGTVIFVRFVVHHILNRKWYTALPKGKWNSRRIFQTALDFLLFIFMNAGTHLTTPFAKMKRSSKKV